MELLFATLHAVLLASIASSSLASIIPRQCKDFAPPSDFKAFDFGDCTAQLTLTKDRYLGVLWKFEATYPDGSRVEHKPIRDNDNFGVSDPLYRDSGTNFLTQYPNNSAFTAVHEFSSVCEFGQAPVSWRFHLTSTGELRCVLDSDTFSSGQIRVAKGRGITRPRQVENVNLRRNTDSGDFRVNWARVTDAVAYSVIIQYPSGRDEIGRPYTSVRGARVPGGITTAIIPTTDYMKEVPRKAIVHAVNAEGVWSLTLGVQYVTGRW